ncbi:elongation factor 4 [Candidatus Microgenomates bacterium]|nr:elongation factor 4 [Candidatus Microgenomates bacterium]
MVDQSQIRNFCIVAHINHGKSTLADRLLELTGAVEKRQMREQHLDRMDLERERGITIKLQPVRIAYRPSVDSRQPPVDGSVNPEFPEYQLRNTNYHQVEYELNLIDTPGHVDFTYEVSRSLAACEGVILLVDSSQGIQAQTLANLHLAKSAGLSITAVVNKIDLPAAEPDRVAQEVADLIGCQPQEVIRISAKTGQGVQQILNRLVKRVPPPAGNPAASLRGLIFDSIYDEHRGVILYVRIVDGGLKAQTQISLMGSGAKGEALEVGIFTPELQSVEGLSAGEIGYIVTNFKSVTEARVGDTITLASNPADTPLAGYRRLSPFVYAGFFPVSHEQQQLLKQSLERLKLNDAALQFEVESSPVLGLGFRVGFLGLLHMEVIKERLQREYGLELIVTNPSTEYQVVLTNGQTQSIHAASDLADITKVTAIREPWIKADVITPKDYVGGVIQRISDIRGSKPQVNYKEGNRAVISFEAPLANVLVNFYDQLKTITSGYGSLSYDLAGWRAEDLAKLDILVAGEVVPPLSQIVHRREAETRGREAVEKLKEVIPRQLFEVSLQAAIGGKIIARKDLKALGKNVTAKLYGGDVTRKRKLWAKQKTGKARMKKFGKIEIPPEAFMVLLKK